MNKSILGGVLGALALATPGIAHAQQIPAATIIIVDRDRVAAECNACKAASSQLQGLVNNFQTRQQTLNQQLQPEAQSIQTAIAAAQKMPAGAARTGAENALQPRLRNFQQRQDAANNELAQMEQNIRSVQANVTQQIIQRLEPIIVNIMRTRGASIAVDKDVTLSFSPALEVTNDALAQFNSQVTSLSVTPLPQPAQQQPPAATPQPQGR